MTSFYLIDAIQTGNWCGEQPDGKGSGRRTPGRASSAQRITTPTSNSVVHGAEGEQEGGGDRAWEDGDEQDGEEEEEEMDPDTMAEMLEQSVKDWEALKTELEEAKVRGGGGEGGEEETSGRRCWRGCEKPPLAMPRGGSVSMQTIGRRCAPLFVSLRGSWILVCAEERGGAIGHLELAAEA